MITHLMNVNNLHLKQERARIYIYIYTHTLLDTITQK